MQIPKIPKKQKAVNKKCLYQDCGVEFEGCKTAKYCEFHREPKNRIKEKKIIEDVSMKNQIINHDNQSVQNLKLKCALEGCDKEFEVKLFPKQYIYPKFCPEHRNDHKRQSHLDSMK